MFSVASEATPGATNASLLSSQVPAGHSTGRHSVRERILKLPRASGAHLDLCVGPPSCWLWGPLLPVVTWWMLLVNLL